jgi:putative zinc finger/helix-turn-helix YgiT family protein
MPPKEQKPEKRPFGADRPFPWCCQHCGESQVVMSTTSYPAEVRHDGRLHTFTIPDLKLPICQACGERVFTEKVDSQIREALRSHLCLLSPDQIREALGRVNLSQKELSHRLGIAEATLSRWLNECQIQSRSMDNLLRVFFALPSVRTALPGQSQDTELGMSDVGEPGFTNPTP